MRRRGITLIEVLIAIAVIAVLAAITTPAILKALFRAKIATSLSNLRQLHLATKLYQLEYSGAVTYGDRYSMGLPDNYVDGLKPYGVPYRLLLSPCGYHPQGVGGVENAWSNTWWPHKVAVYRESTPLWFDLNCNATGDYLYNEFLLRRGNTVLLSGTAVTKVGLGPIFHPEFYVDPEY